MRKEPTLIMDFASRGSHGGVDTIFLIHPPLNPVGIGDQLRLLYVDERGGEQVYNVEITQLRVLEEHAVEFVAHLCCQSLLPTAQSYVFLYVERRHARLWPASFSVITFLLQRPWRRRTIPIPPPTPVELSNSARPPLLRARLPFRRLRLGKRSPADTGSSSSAAILGHIHITTVKTVGQSYNPGASATAERSGF